MISPRRVLVFPLIVGLGVLAACAQPAPDARPAGQVGRILETIPGTVVSASQVTVAGEVRRNSGVGRQVGSVAGGLAGVGVGGVGGILLSAGGRIIGGLLGGAAESEASSPSQVGTEYVIRTDTGETLTIVEIGDAVFAPGQRVVIQQDDRGTARVLPAG
jgi:outer membrane lipoprotein SlyB